MTISKGLLDLDIVAFRSAAVAENESESIACIRAEELLKRILKETGVSSYTGFLTGEDNFRRRINPQYKANRANVPRPRHLPAVRKFLVDHWKAQVVHGYEADDALGMNQTDDTVICSIDKDLLMVKGHHYNFIKNEWKEVTEEEGQQWFYRQALIGDTVDNIFGVKGIGPVKSKQIFSEPLEDLEYFNILLDLYEGDMNRLLMNLDCLWIWRNMDETWTKKYLKSNSALSFLDGLTEGTKALLLQQLEVDLDAGLTSIQY